jgi:ZIP family zinc transporter
LGGIYCDKLDSADKVGGEHYQLRKVFTMNISDLSLAWQALFASLFTSFMTTAGAFVIFFTDKLKKGFSVVAESSAAGIMLAASFFSLLLPAYSYPSNIPAFVSVTVGFCLGGGFVVLIDRVFSHTRSPSNEASKDKTSRLLYAAVTLHNIPEGFAVGVAFAGGDFLSAVMLAVGVGIQNFPEGLCVACPLRARGMSRKKSFFLSALSGLVEIPSALLGALASVFIGHLMAWALSFAAGAMVAVTVAELIPESVEENKPLALCSLLFGFALMMLLDTALG